MAGSAVNTPMPPWDDVLSMVAGSRDFHHLLSGDEEFKTEKQTQSHLGLSGEETNKYLPYFQSKVICGETAANNTIGKISF